MSATVGDRIEVQRQSVHTPVRAGIVENVLSESPGRYGVRWDDGRWGASSRRLTAPCASFRKGNGRLHDVRPRVKNA